MKKFLFIILLLSFSVLSYSLNFSVAPTGFSVELDKTSTQEITIINNTAEPLRLAASFQSDSEFGEKYNLNSNLTIFPKIISLKPAGKQIVRFRVKPDSSIKDGEYKSLLTLTELPGEIKTIPNENNSQTVSSTLKMITEINVAVYGYLICQRVIIVLWRGQTSLSQAARAIFFMIRRISPRSSYGVNMRGTMIFEMLFGVF